MRKNEAMAAPTPGLSVIQFSRQENLSMPRDYCITLWIASVTISALSMVFVVFCTTIDNKTDLFEIVIPAVTNKSSENLIEISEM
uniref:Uncharacterized protein n=1 Tax=Onchocerca volvulus TaxID=6282 RepID=A0A8R1TKU0_ONCVO